jgi:hypothetical protein
MNVLQSCAIFLCLLVLPEVNARVAVSELTTPTIAGENYHKITGASITTPFEPEPSELSEPESIGDTGSGDTGSDDSGLTDGQLAAIIVSSIIGAILVALVAYFVINMYCPVASAANPSFSPVVSLASQPIVVTAL